jgi:predicted 2-oxoglutarate/Fe(II)-dependent dioxygenase YbiX
MVSVLYVDVPGNLIGGELILRSPKRQVGKIAPQVNTLVFFQGDLTHSVNPVTQGRDRLSLVCEQYCLDELELAEIPEFRLESRVNPSKNKIKRLTQSNRKQKSH